MRQDMQQRERQIKKLHESINNYQHSPRTLKNIHKAKIDLENNIQVKYRQSSINQSYTFPKQGLSDDDDLLGQPEVIDLHNVTGYESNDLSIAEEPECKNRIYIADEPILKVHKSGKQNEGHENGCKLKIKLLKKIKKNFDHSNNRIKTQYTYNTDKNKYAYPQFQSTKKQNFSRTLIIGHEASLKQLKKIDSFHQKSLSPHQVNYARTTMTLTAKQQQKKILHSHCYSNIDALNKNLESTMKSPKSKINLSIKSTVKRNLFGKPNNSQLRKGENNLSGLNKNESSRIIKLGTSSREKRKGRKII